MPSWPSWPTGSPPTGSPSSPGRRWICPFRPPRRRPSARRAGRGRLHRIARAYAARACVGFPARGPGRVDWPDARRQQIRAIPPATGKWQLVDAHPDGGAGGPCSRPACPLASRPGVRRLRRPASGDEQCSISTPRLRARSPIASSSAGARLAKRSMSSCPAPVKQRPSCRHARLLPQHQHPAQLVTGRRQHTPARAVSDWMASHDVHVKPAVSVPGTTDDRPRKRSRRPGSPELRPPTSRIARTSPVDTFCPPRAPRTPCRAGAQIRRRAIPSRRDCSHRSVADPWNSTGRTSSPQRRTEPDRAERRSVSARAQEPVPQPIGEYPVGGELITCHGARPGKVVVRRGPQRASRGGEVPDLKVVAGRDGGRAAAELVAKTTTRTDGTVLTSPRMRAMPWSSDSWLPCQGATSGSTSKIIVLTDSSLASANRPASPVTRT